MGSATHRRWLAVMLPLATLRLRQVPERAGVIVLSALASNEAWHWLRERAAAWWQCPLPRPDAARGLAWLTVALISGALRRSQRTRLERLMSAPEDAR